MESRTPIRAAAMSTVCSLMIVRGQESSFRCRRTRLAFGAAPRRRRVCRHAVAVVTRSRHKSLEMSLLWQAVYCSFVAETFLCILLMVISYLPIFIRR